LVSVVDISYDGISGSFEKTEVNSSWSEVGQ